METKIEFECPYTIEERYQMITTGEYGVFDLYDANGDVTGYRGYRKEFGTTGVYDNYRDAMEAALTLYGSMSILDVEHERFKVLEHLQSFIKQEITDDS